MWIKEERKESGLREVVIGWKGEERKQDVPGHTRRKDLLGGNASQGTSEKAAGATHNFLNFESFLLKFLINWSVPQCIDFNNLNGFDPFLGCELQIDI